MAERTTDNQTVLYVFRARDDFPVDKDGELLSPTGRRLDLSAVAVAALFGLLLAVGGLLYQRVGVSYSSGVNDSDVETFAAWGRLFFAVGLALFACCGLAEGYRRVRIDAEVTQAGFADVEQYRRAFRTARMRVSRMTESSHG